MLAITCSRPDCQPPSLSVGPAVLLVAAVGVILELIVLAGELAGQLQPGPVPGVQCLAANSRTVVMSAIRKKLYLGLPRSTSKGVDCEDYMAKRVSSHLTTAVRWTITEKHGESLTTQISSVHSVLNVYIVCLSSPVFHV